MTTSTVNRIPLAAQVSFGSDEFVVSLVDGRRLTVPIIWFPQLAKATRTQLENYELLGDGEGIFWPDIDEDLSVAGLLR